MIKLLAQTCGLTRVQELMGDKYDDNSYHHRGYSAWDNRPPRDSYQAMTVDNQTITLNATSPKLYGYLAAWIKTLNAKPRQLSMRFSPPPSPVRVERIGSHQEFVETTPKHGYHNIVCDYKTYFDDCIPGKAWLKAHYQDVIPEPTIEITAGKQSISLNGDYKPGMIKEFVKANKS